MNDDNDALDTSDGRQPDVLDPETAPADPESPEAVPPVAPLTGPRLVVKRSGAETDVVFAFSPPATIGRFDPAVGPIDVDLGSIPEGSYVSRKHAKITCEDDVYRITDLGSSNGTFVLRGDFERVDETEIVDGDEIALGNARLVFRVG